MQSKGVGSAVLRHTLDRCDTEGTGAPTVTAMWRDAR